MAKTQKNNTTTQEQSKFLKFIDKMRESSSLLIALAIFTGLLAGGVLAGLTSESVYMISPTDYVYAEVQPAPADAPTGDYPIATTVTRISPDSQITNTDTTFMGEFKRTEEIKIKEGDEFVTYYKWRVGTNSFIVTPDTEQNIRFSDRIGSFFSTMWNAYKALFTSSIGNPAKMVEAVKLYFATGEKEDLRWAFNPFFESLVVSTPYILVGLGVALGFRTGLFNIGAEGQVFMGAAAAVAAGIFIKGLPPILHVSIALLAGAAGGAIWGFVPGWLKAKTGGHEVINTIMMNYIAFRLSDYLLSTVLQDPNTSYPVSSKIQPSAELYKFFETPIRFHAGFFFALAMAFLVYWLLFKTKWGFDLRTVGENPRAAKYAGMNIVASTVIAMSLSGALAGLAGANEILGVNHFLSAGFSSGLGFDSIALALLGKSHPLGVVLASLLFGFLRNGAIQMQISAGIPIDIITVIQSLILMFIAAPEIIRSIYRLKEKKAVVIPVEKEDNGGEK